jgi:hypothetical protein
MTDYNAMIRQLFTAPARAMTAQPPQANLGGGMIEKLHNALDPVQAMGGYGNMMAMALPPGVKPIRGSAFETIGSELGTLYHGGKSKISSVDQSKLQSRDYGFYGKGFYTTTNPTYAKAYGGRVSKFSLGDESRVLEASLKASDAPHGLVDAVKKDIFESGSEAAKSRGKIAAFREEIRLIDRDHLAWKDAVGRFAEKYGYDAVRYGPGEVVVKNPAALKPTK